MTTSTFTLTEFLLARITECVAMRRIVELHTEAEPGAHECPGRFSSWSVAQGAPCPTLRMLALLYANHPDYREEWKL